MAPSDVVPRSCLSLVLLAALVTPAIAQEPQILAVLPAYGNPGSEVTIVGSGFTGSVAPKVWLEFAGDGGEPQKFRMRVLDWSESEIHAKVLAGEAGNCQLMVKAQHQDPVGAAFKVLMPQVISLSPTSAAPGEMVTVSGASFGPKSGRVLLFQRPCKVVEWSDSAVVFKVPGNVPDGQWTPRVSNSIGEAVAFSALSVSGSAAVLPEPFVRMKVDGTLFVAQDGDVLASDLGSKLGFDAFDSGDVVAQHLAVLVPFAPATGKVPKLFTGSSSGSQPVVFELVPQGDSGLEPSLYAAQTSGLPWKVHLLGSSQGELFGLLSAVLQRVSGPGPDTLALEDGLLLVDP